jgi:hypothetical protein
MNPTLETIGYRKFLLKVFVFIAVLSSFIPSAQCEVQLGPYLTIGIGSSEETEKGTFSFVSLAQAIDSVPPKYLPKEKFVYTHLTDIEDNVAFEGKYALGNIKVTSYARFHKTMQKSHVLFMEGEPGQILISGGLLVHGFSIYHWFREQMVEFIESLGYHIHFSKEGASISLTNNGFINEFVYDEKSNYDALIIDVRSFPEFRPTLVPTTVDEKGASVFEDRSRFGRYEESGPYYAVNERAVVRCLLKLSSTNPMVIKALGIKDGSVVLSDDDKRTVLAHAERNRFLKYSYRLIYLMR